MPRTSRAYAWRLKEALNRRVNGCSPTAPNSLKYLTNYADPETLRAGAGGVSSAAVSCYCLAPNQRILRSSSSISSAVVMILAEAE